jgi:GTP-binding protein HflX
LAQKVSGPQTGLKAAQRSALSRIYRRSVRPNQVVTVELAQFMAELSHAVRRQIGVLIDRRGKIQHVIIGDSSALFLPDLGRHRAGTGRLRGLRLIHTHVQGEPLSRDDLTDLSLLRLDLVGVLQIDERGQASTLEVAHLIPKGRDGRVSEVLSPEPIGTFSLDFDVFIDDLELRLGARKKSQKVGAGEALRSSVSWHGRRAWSLWRRWFSGGREQIHALCLEAASFRTCSLRPCIRRWSLSSSTVT